MLATLLVAAPAEAKHRRLNLHRGSSGSLVTLLETRLSRLGFLTPSAVDRQLPDRHRARRASTFQWRLGMPVTGRVNRRDVERDPARAGETRGHPRDPSVLGHRGEVTSHAGENTLPALQAAAPYVNFLEFDLHLTADHVLVLMHDTTLDRTTNCTGPVSSWTLDGPARPVHGGRSAVPTFDEVAAYAASAGRAIAPGAQGPGR